jgi:hypothetical protein
MPTMMAAITTAVPASPWNSTSKIKIPVSGRNGTSRCLGRSSSRCLRASRSAPQMIMASLANSAGWMVNDSEPR